MLKDSFEFKENLIVAGIKDIGCHHEFTSRRHGEKLDFDIVERGSDLWQQWVSLKAELIRRIHDKEDPPMLVSIANGTIDITNDVSIELNRYGNYSGPVLVGHTEKFVLEDKIKVVRLTEAAKHLIAYSNPNTVIEIDDAATTGSTTAMPIPKLKEMGIENIKVVYAWLRNMYLPNLEKERIQSFGVIDNSPLPDYSEQECREFGFCYQGSRLIEYGLKE